MGTLEPSLESPSQLSRAYRSTSQAQKESTALLKLHSTQVCRLSFNNSELIQNIVGMSLRYLSMDHTIHETGKPLLSPTWPGL